MSAWIDGWMDPFQSTTTTRAPGDAKEYTFIEMFIFQWIQLPSAANNPDNNNNSPTTISVFRWWLSILINIARAV